MRTSQKRSHNAVSVVRQEMTDNDSRGIRLSAVQRLVKLSKVITLLSAVFTILCVLVVFGSQVASWSRTGVWDTYRLSSVVRSSNNDHRITYTTASVNKSQRKLSSKEAIIDLLLETPTIAILLIAAAFHFWFYLYLAVLDGEQQNV
jgi:hypothetical protein